MTEVRNLRAAWTWDKVSEREGGGKSPSSLPCCPHTQPKCDNYPKSQTMKRAKRGDSAGTSQPSLHRAHIERLE